MSNDKGIFFTDEIIAAATAKSAAGSLILMPPAIFRKISIFDKWILHLASKTALNIDSLAMSQPTIVLRGDGRVEGVTSACTSTKIGLVPSKPAKIAAS